MPLAPFRPLARAAPRAPAPRARAASARPAIRLVGPRWVGVTFDKDAARAEQLKRATSGAQWVPEQKLWRLPLVQVPQLVAAFGGKRSADVERAVRDAYRATLAERAAAERLRPLLETTYEIPGLLEPAFGYQRVGVEFFHRCGERVGIYDDVGLGKTLQGIGCALSGPGAGYRTLVVCPGAVKIGWERSIRRFAGRASTVWTGDAWKGDLDAQFHVINYDILVRHRTVLDALGFDLVVLDEAHLVTNPEAARTIACFGGTLKVADEDGRREVLLDPLPMPKALALTATPLANHPCEAFPIAHFLRPDLFPSFPDFGHAYGAFPPGNLANLPSTPKNLPALHEALKPFVLRRLEHEVNRRERIPPFDFWIELTPRERAGYDRLLRALLGEWAEAGKPSLQQMHIVREYLNGVKLPYVYRLIDELLAANKPTVLFSTRLEAFERTLAHYGDRAVGIRGGWSLKRRQASIDRFAAGGADVCVVMLRAGGTGVDGLQHRSHHGIFLDQDYVYLPHHQARGRIDRTGQRETVRMYWAMVADTIDELLRGMHRRKREYQDVVVDGAAQDATFTQSRFADVVAALRAAHPEIAHIADAPAAMGGLTDPGGDDDAPDD